ncbi:hypothetical protein RFI_09331, partial [Reticulomyxa filosa]
CEFYDENGCKTKDDDCPCEGLDCPYEGLDWYDHTDLTGVWSLHFDNTHFSGNIDQLSQQDELATEDMLYLTHDQHTSQLKGYINNPNKCQVFGTVDPNGIDVDLIVIWSQSKDEAQHFAGYVTILHGQYDCHNGLNCEYSSWSFLLLYEHYISFKELDKTKQNTQFGSSSSSFSIANITDSKISEDLRQQVKSKLDELAKSVKNKYFETVRKYLTEQENAHWEWRQNGRPTNGNLWKCNPFNALYEINNVELLSFSIDVYTYIYTYDMYLYILQFVFTLNTAKFQCIWRRLKLPRAQWKEVEYYRFVRKVECALSIPLRSFSTKQVSIAREGEGEERRRRKRRRRRGGGGGGRSKKKKRKQKKKKKKDEQQQQQQQQQQLKQQSRICVGEIAKNMRRVCVGKITNNMHEIYVRDMTEKIHKMFEGEITKDSDMLLKYVDAVYQGSANEECHEDYFNDIIHWKWLNKQLETYRYRPKDWGIFLHGELVQIRFQHGCPRCPQKGKHNFWHDGVVISSFRRSIQVHYFYNYFFFFFFFSFVSYFVCAKMRRGEGLAATITITITHSTLKDVYVQMGSKQNAATEIANDCDTSVQVRRRKSIKLNRDLDMISSNLSKTTGYVSGVMFSYLFFFIMFFFLSILEKKEKETKQNKKRWREMIGKGQKCLVQHKQYGWCYAEVLRREGAFVLARCDKANNPSQLSWFFIHSSQIQPLYCSDLSSRFRLLLFCSNATQHPIYKQNNEEKENDLLRKLPADNKEDSIKLGNVVFALVRSYAEHPRYLVIRYCFCNHVNKLLLFINSPKVNTLTSFLREKKNRDCLLSARKIEPKVSCVLCDPKSTIKFIVTKEFKKQNVHKLIFFFSFLFERFLQIPIVLSRKRAIHWKILFQ